MGCRKTTRFYCVVYRWASETNTRVKEHTSHIRMGRTLSAIFCHVRDTDHSSNSQPGRLLMESSLIKRSITWTQWQVLVLLILWSVIHYSIPICKKCEFSITGNHKQGTLPRHVLIVHSDHMGQSDGPAKEHGYRHSLSDQKTDHWDWIPSYSDSMFVPLLRYI